MRQSLYTEARERTEFQTMGVICITFWK